MTRSLLALALIALAFGLGAFYISGGLGGFALAHLGIAAAALAAALILTLRGVTRHPFRPTVEWYRSFVIFAGSLAIFAMIVARSGSGTPLVSWVHEDAHSLSPITEKLLAKAPPLRAELFAAARDPRIPATRALLRSVAEAAELTLEEVRTEGEPPSNQVVLTVGESTVVLSKPSEGALYEALAAELETPAGDVLVATGAGEGNLEDRGENGYTGLGAAIRNAGFRARPWQAALGAKIPEEARFVLILRPQKPYTAQGIAALDAFLERGGRIAAFLDPGTPDPLLRWLDGLGIRATESPVVDPDAPQAEAGVPGTVLYHYGRHPVVRPLGPSDATFFGESLGFKLHKKHRSDELFGLAFTGIGGRPRDDRDAAGDFVPLVVAAEREDGGRVVVFGDAEIASNRLLRAVYNLDLVMNALEWVGGNRERISIRPKSNRAVAGQRPVVLGDTLVSFFGAGLLVPELLLLAAALLWVRRGRS